MFRKTIRYLFLLVFFGLIIVCVLEVILRILGYVPFHPNPPGGSENSREFDPELGWVLLPGHYEVGPFNDIGDSMSITIKSDTGRVTRSNNEFVGTEQVTFLGGSFIMGHGLDNDETAVWKLQERFPHLDFRNLATSAYGGYQSLMVLEKELIKGNRPKCVIYGAIQHHELRNVAEGGWLVSLRTEMPYLTLSDKNTFTREGLIGMKHVFLSQVSATAFLAEKTLNKVLSFPRVRNARTISHLVIAEMQRLCSENQVAFYVAPLSYDTQGFQDLTKFLEANAIAYIDCNVPLTQKNTIKDDGHPGAGVNDIWVERIEKRLFKDRIVQNEQ